MPLDADLLDPTIDLAPHLQATFERMSAQNGGRNKRVMEYKNLAVQGKGPNDVLASSYDEQERREQEAIAALAPQTGDVRRDPNFFMDAHMLDYGPAPLPTPAEQIGAGGSLDVRTPAPMDAPAPETPLGGILGNVLPSQVSGTGQAQPGQPVQLDTTRLDAINEQIRRFLDKPQTEYTPAPMPSVDSPSAILTGLAIALAPPNQAGNIMLALSGNQQSLQQRNDLLARLHAQTRDARDRQALEALLKQAAQEEARAYHQATLQTRADIAAGTQAGQDRRLGTKEAGINARQEKTLKARAELSAMNDATKRYVAGLKDPVQKVQALIGLHYDPETAREIVYSKELESLSRRAKLDTENDFLQQTFGDRAEALILKNLDTKAATALKGAQKGYYEEMTRLMPEKQAMAWALANSLMDYRTGSLDLGGARLDMTGEKLDEAVMKAGEAAQANADYYQQLLDKGIDENGEDLSDNARTLYEIKRDGFQKMADKAMAPGQEPKSQGGLGGMVRSIGEGFKSAFGWSGNAKNDQGIVSPHLQEELGGIAQGLGMRLGVTTAKTGHRTMTKSGFRSRHMDGNAIDVTSINGYPVTSKEGAALADKLVSELRRQGYAWNTESGHDRAVLWKTNVGGNHFNHLHISNRLRAQSDNPYQISGDPVL